MTKHKNSNSYSSKTQMVTNLKNLLVTKPQKLKLWKNSKAHNMTKLKNSN